MSATPATRNEGGCKIVPRLPRETKVDVRLCHACHAKCRGVTRDQGAPKPDPSAPPSAMSARPPTQNDGGGEVVATPATHNAAASRATRAHPNQTQARHPLPWVPRLPRETKVDVRLCHACHAKWGWMWVLCHACHAKWRGVTRDQGAPKPAQARHPLPWVPRLPRKTLVDVSLCHACHAKRWWMWVCATPATQNGAASRATRARPNQTQARHPLPWVPRLPRETKVAVSLCHAATRNEGGCEFVPRLPRKMARRHARPGRAQTRPKRATHCHECHACHAKRLWMWVCATPATRNDGGCEFVPRLPRKMARRHARPGRTQTRPKRATHCHECHACHAKHLWMWVCAMPATRNDGGCEFVPRLPRKMARRHARPGRAQTRTPATRNTCGCEIVPRLHAKRRWMWVCATPATRNDGGCEFVPRLPLKCDVCVCVWVWVCVCMWNYCMLSLCVCEVIVCERRYVTKLCERWYVTKLCVCVWSYCMWEMLCEKVVCVSVCEVIVCESEKVVCVWVCVKLLYVKCDKVVCVCGKVLYVKFVCVCEVIVC